MDKKSLGNKLIYIGIFIICIGMLLKLYTMSRNSKNVAYNNNNSDENQTEFAMKMVEDDSYYDDNFEEYYEDNRVNFTYINLNDKYYYIIYEDDDSTEEEWIYETEITDVEKYSGYLEEYNDEIVYIIDNGKLVALNIDNGDVLWKNEDEILDCPSYRIRENGTIDLCFGSTNKRFISIDKTGAVLKSLDLSQYYNEEVNGYMYIDTVEDEYITIRISTEELPYDESIKINLNSYEVIQDSTGVENVTTELLNGKTLYCEDYETYYFDADGTFSCSKNGNITEKYSMIRTYGTWSIEEGVLKLKTTKGILAYGGTYDNDENGYKIVVNYTEKEISIEAEREYPIKYCSNYDGKEMFFMDYSKYEVVEPKG